VPKDVSTKKAETVKVRFSILLIVGKQLNFVDNIKQYFREEPLRKLT